MAVEVLDDRRSHGVSIPSSATDSISLSAQLPITRTPLVGRRYEVETVRELLLRRDDVPMVTFTGPGGVGKTRLALHIAASVASDFADGVCFVDLAALHDPDLVVPTIARAF